jgi:hypothetical protein
MCSDDALLYAKVKKPLSGLTKCRQLLTTTDDMLRRFFERRNQVGNRT